MSTPKFFERGGIIDISEPLSIIAVYIIEEKNTNDIMKALLKTFPP
jgi:hypothetical protein